MHNFYIVQAGYGIFGSGDTPEAAYSDATEWAENLPPFEELPRYVGTAADADGLGRKDMTQFGELFQGQMVLIDAETLKAWKAE